MGSAGPLRGVRIAVGYDCLFPATVGGAERWYLRLSEALRDAGADVTYLTRRQWDGPPPGPEGVRVVAVSGRSELYGPDGNRRLAPTLAYGWGLTRWMLTHRADYDALQVANFPFWSVLGSRLAVTGTRTQLTVDWFEVWSRPFWQDYAGRVAGFVGFAVQRLCIAASPSTIVLSPHTAERLRRQGVRHRPLVLSGLLTPLGTGPAEAGTAEPDSPPYLFFAGRHIRDKGLDLLPGALRRLRVDHPDLRLVVAGDGPLRADSEEEFARCGLADAVDFVGFVSDQRLAELRRRAVCAVVPSRREGYGLAVVEAAGAGVPVVTTAFDENLATDHIDGGRNGWVADPPTPDGLARAVEKVLDGGAGLRASTLDWYLENVPLRTMERSLAEVVAYHVDRIGAAGS